MGLLKVAAAASAFICFSSKCKTSFWVLEGTLEIERRFIFVPKKKVFFLNFKSNFNTHLAFDSLHP